jgi:uncharacterized protein with von Willebrand factor type A (vWA) domain
MATITNELPLQTADPQTFLPLDLPVVATAFGRRLRDAGLPVTPAQAEQCVLSLALVKPTSRHALYYTTRAVFVTGPRQLATFDRVFSDVFDAVARSRG